MSIYPSLEDLKVDQLCKAQLHLESQYLPSYGATSAQTAVSYPSAPLYPSIDNPSPLPYPVTPQTNPTYSISSNVYPSLADYMGLELSPAVIAANMPEYAGTVAIQPPREMSRLEGGMVAPISNLTQGLQKAQVNHGIRELILCKDEKGKVGVRVAAINKGIFVCLVMKNSPAAMAGLRFGDQILQVNGQVVAAYTKDQVHDLFKKSSVNGISVIVRDRPFERTVTLHKDSVGQLGFQFKNGEIFRLVKDSSAARNGILTEHNLLEVDGQNVVGLKDKEIVTLIEKAPSVVTVTVIPSFVYNHMMKKMAGNLVKEAMDHSVPTL
ncbi:syntenin-1-like [Macrosteles quadrilineatus]|uniref:syntenin-1-like n=1 Tax=Macrosteles quadrilineatus TaxID=74068 RepID=UPI0023E28C31|nr:syntenin-1-like [Macrosteles quadrilineatus]